MTRTRNTLAHRAGGSWGRYTWGPDSTPGPDVISGRYRCDDEVLRGDGHPLSIDKRWFEGFLINKPWTGYYDSWFINYVADAARGWDAIGWGHGSVPGTPTNPEAATAAVKGTNPSRAVVDIPISIAEFVEIPHLIKEGGTRLIRESRHLASNNLWLQFAIVPLVSDLMKSFEFQRHFANRAKELKRLRKGGRGKTLTVFSGTTTGKFAWTVHSNGLMLRPQASWSTAITKRVFVPWIPSAEAPETDEQMRKAAIKAVLGLTADVSTLWELIPWSWLIDWFSNAGAYFSAHRNVVGMSAGTCQVMTEGRTQTMVGPQAGSGWSFSGGVCHTVTKQRALSSPSFSAQLPFLNARQLSILGSLYVLRQRR